MFLIAEPSEPILVDPCGLRQPFVHPNFESGYITSPNYPESYPNSANCSWLIQTHNSYSLELQLMDIDLEPRYKTKHNFMILNSNIILVWFCTQHFIIYQFSDGIYWKYMMAIHPKKILL